MSKMEDYQSNDINIDSAFYSLYNQIKNEPNFIEIEDKLTTYILSPKYNRLIVDIFTRFNKIIKHEQLTTLCIFNDKIPEYNYFINDGKTHCNSIIHDFVELSRNDHYLYEIIMLVLIKCDSMQ